MKIVDQKITVNQVVIVFSILCSLLLTVQSLAENLHNTSNLTSAPGATPSTTDEKRLLTLVQCVDLALKHNPGLAVIDYEKAIQGLEKPLARSAFLPTLDVESSYTRFEEKLRVVPSHRDFEPGVFDEDALGADLVLRLPLYQGGKRVAAYRIAQLSEKGAVEQLATTRQDLVLNLYSLFYKTIQLSQLIEATHVSLRAVEVQRDTTQLQVDVGRAAPLDGMKIDVRLASLGQQLSNLQANHKVLLFQLARLMGVELSEGQLFELEGELTARPKNLPDLHQATIAAYDNRPELKSSRIQLEKAQRELDLAKADRLPRVDGFAAYGLQSGLPYDQDPVIGGIDHETAWSTGIEVRFPLFRGGAIQTRISQAGIRIKQAEERLREIRLRIGQELQGAFASLEDSRNRLSVTGEAVALAQEALRIEQSKYREGKNIINDVLDAQAAMLQAEVEQTQAAADYLIAEMEWQRAMGKELVSWLKGGSIQ